MGVRAFCVECGVALTGDGMTEANVAADEHAREVHDRRRSYLSPPVLVIPDDVDDRALLELQVGFLPVRLATVRVGVLRNETAQVRGELVAARLAAEGRLN